MKKIFGFSLLVCVSLGLTGCSEKKEGATMEEAQMAKLGAVLAGFEEYYTSHSKFSSDIGAMTVVQTPLELRDKICVEFATKGDKELEIRVNRDDKICKKAFGSLKSGKEEKMYDGVGKIIVR